MASEREDCIDRIVKAAAARGVKMSRDQAMDALDEILSRAESKGPDWKGIDEKLAEAAKEMTDAAAERASVLKRNERMDALKSIERHRYYARAASPQEGFEAKLVGINSSFAGHRRSVDYAYKGKRREIMGGFVHELEREGVDKLYASRALEREWATELHELNKVRGGRPGITGSAEALKIAEAIKRWQTTSIDGINREGGWIKSYSGYITRTSHDPDKIRKAGGLAGDEARDRWVEDVLGRIDIKRTFHDADPEGARQHLRELWTKFVIGDHFDHSRPLEDLDGLIKVDFARKASAPRELHFKSADDWLAYNERYGVANPTAQVMSSFDRGARSYALLKEFGSKPRQAFEEDLEYLKARFADQPEVRRSFDKWEGALRNRFALLDGSALRPVNRTHASIVAGWMAVQRMAKLGLTPFAMLSDLATKAAELRYQGADFFERWGSMVTGYFRGAAGSEKREVADLLYAGVAARIGDIAARYDGGDTPAGWISRAENQFFKITGISPMTYNQRADSEVIMARHLGSQRGKAYEALGAAERRILKGFEIGKAEWALLHKADWHDYVDPDGTVRTYLTPDVAKALKPEDVKAYLVEAGGLHKDAQGASVDFRIERAREDLAQKLWTYFTDRGEFAVIEAGARERAILYQGRRPGDVPGSALRLMLQFKQFPLTMMTKAWGRELHGGQGRMDKIAGLTELFISSTLFGMMANFLNQTAKGQDPTSAWRNRPGQAVLSGIVRGGAGSIWGDFMLGEFSRHGHSATQTLVGPTISQLDKIAEIYSDLTHMKGRAATGMLASRLVRDNLPFANMIYTKAAFDYLVFYRLQEAINPGYLQRYERTMKDKPGIEFWLRPSQVSR